MFVERIYIIIGAVILDLLVGDPHGLYHPVQAIGTLISFLEKKFRNTKIKERTAGGILALLVILMTTLSVILILMISGRIHPYLKRVLSIIMCYQMLAMKSLRTESMKVYTAFKKGDTEGARSAVAMIVGRDTSVLDEEGIKKAAVETVAENCSDGVTAPLLFMILFGVPGMWGYKAVNTMDSMIGYQNERYRNFGTAAARLDDVLNFIPSRISALFMIAGAFIMEATPVSKGKISGKGAWKIWRRDRRNHKSPNSAQTEAACAGALGLLLAGDAVYFGKTVRKPTIGDNLRTIETEDIRRANDLMYLTSFLMIGMGILLLFVIGLNI